LIAVGLFWLRAGYLCPALMDFLVGYRGEAGNNVWRFYLIDGIKVTWRAGFGCGWIAALLGS
jgi:hypothetical protein